MALSGIYQKGNWTFEWNGVNNETANTTKVSVRVKYRYNVQYGHSDGSVTATIDTETQQSTFAEKDENLSDIGYETETVFSKDFVIEHNPNGEKKCKFVFKCWVGYHSTDFEFEEDLDAIIRSAQIRIKQLPIFNKQNLVVEWDSVSDDYYYTLSIRPTGLKGGVSWTDQRREFSVASAIYDATKKVYSYEASQSEYIFSSLSFYRSVPGILIELKTYSGSPLANGNSAVQIGETSVVSVDVILPKDETSVAAMKPLISSSDTVVINPDSVPSNWNIAIAGISAIKLKATFTPQADYKISPNGFKLTGEYNVQVQGSASQDEGFIGGIGDPPRYLHYTGEVVNKFGNVDFYISAANIWGYESDTVKKTVGFYKYYEPFVKVNTGARDGTDSSKVKLSYDLCFAPLGGKNTVSVSCRYRECGSQTWQDCLYSLDVIVPSGYTGFDAEMESTETYTVEGLEDTKSYEIELIATDDLGTVSSSMVVIPPIDVLVDFRAGGKGMAIGGVAMSDNLEIRKDTIFFNNIFIASGETTISLADYIKQIIEETKTQGGST